MNAIDRFSDLLDLCNGSGECPHVPLQHVTNLDGYAECESAMVMMLESIAAELIGGVIAPEHAASAAGHVIVLAVALGYSLGADGTAETFQTVEIPDTLAALDFLDPVRGDN